jgi:hypothetical protein
LPWPGRSEGPVLPTPSTWRQEWRRGVFRQQSAVQQINHVNGGRTHGRQFADQGLSTVNAHGRLSAFPRIDGEPRGTFRPMRMPQDQSDPLEVVEHLPRARGRYVRHSIPGATNSTEHPTVDPWSSVGGNVHVDIL